MGSVAARVLLAAGGGLPGRLVCADRGARAHAAHAGRQLAVSGPAGRRRRVSARPRRSRHHRAGGGAIVLLLLATDPARPRLPGGRWPGAVDPLRAGAAIRARALVPRDPFRQPGPRHAVRPRRRRHLAIAHRWRPRAGGRLVGARAPAGAAADTVQHAADRAPAAHRARLCHLGVDDADQRAPGADARARGDHGPGHLLRHHPAGLRDGAGGGGVDARSGLCPVRAAHAAAGPLGRQLCRHQRLAAVAASRGVERPVGLCPAHAGAGDHADFCQRGHGVRHPGAARAGGLGPWPAPAWR